MSQFVRQAVETFRIIERQRPGKFDDQKCAHLITQINKARFMVGNLCEETWNFEKIAIDKIRRNNLLQN